MPPASRLLLAALLSSSPALADEATPSDAATGGAAGEGATGEGATGEGATPSARERGEGRALMEAGKNAFRGKRYEEAAKLFEAAYRADPTLLIALYNRAFALRKGEKLAEARDAYRAFLEKAPDDLDGLFGLAETERRLGDAKAAVRGFSTYVEKEKRADKARYVAYAKQQIARLAEQIATAPPEPAPAADALVAEAERAYAEKRYADAAALYARAYEADPKRSDALYRQALSLRKAERLDEARAAYERFLEVVPEDPDGTYGLAETLRLLDDKARAADLFERYVQIEKRPSEARFVARARNLVVELRSALEAARVAQAPAAEPKPAPVVEPAAPPASEPPAAPSESVPPPPDVGAGPTDAHRARLGRAVVVRDLLHEGERSLAAGQPAIAGTHFTIALAAAPEASEAARTARRGRARAFDALGRWEDARAEEALLADLARSAQTPAVAADGETANASGTTNPTGGAARAPAVPARGPSEAFLARAAALTKEAREALASGDARAAAEKAEGALGYDPTGLEALLLLGEARLKLDDEPAAERAFSRALALHPKAARPLWALARLHDSQGHLDDAKRYYRLYLQSDAKDRDPELVREAEYKLEIP